MTKSKIYHIVLLLVVGFTACKEPIRTIDLSELTISEIHKAYKEGDYDSNQLVKAYLNRIKDLDSTIQVQQ